MPLDPIVSLAVSIAESAGSCAFLVGSGVSRDAGVLTGVEVYWRAVEDLYKAELRQRGVQMTSAGGQSSVGAYRLRSLTLRLSGAFAADAGA